MSNVFPLDPRNVPPTPLPSFGGSAAPAFDLAEEEAEDETLTVTINDDGTVDIIAGDDESAEDETGQSDFDANLADGPAYAGKLSQIADDLLEGIEADTRSRDEWEQDYITGLALLGLKVNDQQESAGLSGAFLSKVKHSLLLEACLTFQARARGELLPADGPAKVRNDGDDSAERDKLASDLEEDFNHFLTAVATEYYPDTDRTLFLSAFGGCTHKKVYRCARRNRPVSESVELPDLIVSNDSTDLANAARVTHRIVMSPTQYRAMVKAGIYIDVALGFPYVDPSSIERANAEIKGIAVTPQRQKDQPYTIYETYTEFPLEDADEPYPYKVSIDKDSRRILEVRRNWKEDDEDKKPRKRFVKWPFIPGPGYLDIGFLHILGQHAKALTAIERILIDAGMFANFPGGVKVKGGRTDPNQIRPAPGEWVDVDIGTSARIQDSMMALPYSGPNAELMALWDKIESNARQLAGTAEIETGDGRTNAPVGTVMAMLEQQTQLMTAVHKRQHTAQQEELMLFRELFLEDPESLTRGNPKATRTWTAEALADMSFVPASDPNVPAQAHRIMLGSAMIAVAKEYPELYDVRAVHQRAWQAAHVSDIDSFLLPPVPADNSQNDMLAQLAQAQLKIATMEAENNRLQAEAAGLQAQAKLIEAQGKPQEAAARAQSDQVKAQADQMRAQADMQSQAEADALERERLRIEQSEADKDRASKEGIAAMQDQTKLIIEGIRVDAAAASADPVHDDKAGP